MASRVRWNIGYAEVWIMPMIGAPALISGAGSVVVSAYS
jgi:hypothetical protein